MKIIKKELNVPNKEKYGGYSPEIASLVSFRSLVLDVGCSTGLLARFLSQEKGCKVFGVDIDPDSVKEASVFCEKSAVCDLEDVQKLKKILGEEKFDVITFGDIIEHLRNPGELLTNLGMFLKDKGLILASIPNSAFILLRLKFLLGDFSYDKTGGMMDEAHLRFFNFKTAKLLFEKSSYKVNRMYGVNIVKDKFFFLRPLARIWPSLFAIHIIIVAEKL